MQAPEVPSSIPWREVIAQRPVRDRIPAVRCTNTARTTGARCKLPAVKGSEPPRCNIHGVTRGSLAREQADANLALDVQARIAAMVPKAMARVEQIIDQPLDDKVALAAAKDILDRAGHGAVHKHEVGGPGAFADVDSDIERLLSGGEDQR